MSMSLKRIIIASVLMILTMVFDNYLNHEEIIQPNKRLSTFPTKIGEWVGKEDRFDENTYEVLSVDDFFFILT